MVKPYVRRRSRRAFTLIELLVAMTIFSILGMLIFVAMDRTASLSTQARERIEAGRVSQECLDLIGRDLSKATIAYDRTASNSLQLQVNPPSLDDRYANPSAILWQAPVARSTAQGNLAIIGYFALRDLQADPANNRLQLRRLYVEPDAASDYKIYSSTDWHASDLLEKFAPNSGADDDANGHRGWVADGVLGLWVRCLDASGNPITKTANGTLTGNSFDSRQAFSSGAPDNRIYPTSSTYSALPAFVEVGIVTCSPRDMKRIGSLPAYPANHGPETFYEDMAAFVEQARASNPQAKSINGFSRKIHLYAADP